MRGKVFLPRGAGLVIRITPAYAGKSFQFLAQKHKRRDHPRLCGEKDQREQPHIVEQGSPPPMRGKALFAHQDAGKRRITPAYAGKSLMSLLERRII